MAITWKKKVRKTERYIVKVGGGAKPVCLRELGGSCTSGEEKNRMEGYYQCQMRHLAQTGTVMMMITFLISVDISYR